MRLLKSVNKMTHHELIKLKMMVDARVEEFKLKKKARRRALDDIKKHWGEDDA
jgi:hypothetical protein